MSMKEFAHLKKEEKIIAERWVQQLPIQGKREWDLHLEVPLPEIPAHWTKQDLKRWEGLISKRIDLVVHADDAIWIMEITPKLSKASVGGCQVYKDLYTKQFQPSKPVKCGIIVEVDDPAYHSIIEKLDIALWVV